MSNNRFANPDPRDLEHDRPLLSRQERNVVTNNGTYEEIAEDLGISETTVGTYRTRANKKLEAQVDMIKIMLEQQYQDDRRGNLEDIAEQSVERLKDLGVDAELNIED